MKTYKKLTHDIVIAGGGLAGLTAAILLARKQYRVLLCERKKYPFHRVCGEYVSNEVLPFLKKNDLFPATFNPPAVRSFLLTGTNGQKLTLPLDLGGFGISRYAFDHYLFQKAREAGAEICENCEVSDISFQKNTFTISTSEGVEYTAPVVIGAYGKQARLDRQLDRDFTEKENDYVGIKYHVTGDFKKDEVALHNFRGGYCGISAIEEGKFNLCYLVRRTVLREYGSPGDLEEAILRQNPYLDDIFTEASHLFEKPMVISNFGFYPRTAVQNHVLMTGDAAGLITPLCGNGMAMAIHAAKIAADTISRHMPAGTTGNREALEKEYVSHWNSSFRTRLAVGRKVQQVFGHPVVSGLAVRVAGAFTPLARSLMKRTHGRPFQ
ncbi:NAD(P)/FAD-dependent oxidoreductase [Roseivirga sp. BDSF3-8]|uniref:NAD(P)/FAD-dependent oxidoreductase n=1 Tax=Roseivirga sp. BDSF3-8 TaxID=3241598 RepID=UPI0035323C43